MKSISLELAELCLTGSRVGCAVGKFILCFIVVVMLVAVCAIHGRKTNLIRSSSKKLLTLVKSKKLFGSIRKRRQQLPDYGLTALEDDISCPLQDASQNTPSVAIWQRNILMGERCELPSFSGLIVYDASGNQVTVVSP